MPEWVNVSTRPILETLLDFNAPLSAKNIHVLLERKMRNPPADSTVYRAVDSLQEYGLIIQSPEAKTLYEISPIGIAYLNGEIDAEALEPNPYSMFEGKKGNPNEVYFVGERLKAESGEYGWGRINDQSVKLANRMIVEVTGDEALATKYKDRFGREVVSNFSDEWDLSAESVRHYFRARGEFDDAN